MAPTLTTRWFRREYRAPLVALLLAAALSCAGFAQAGELARLHRELAAAGADAKPSPAGKPVSPNHDGGPPGVLPVQPLPERPLATTTTIERIGFEGLRCRGTCPAFTVIFYTDGTFSYVGESDVERLGEGSGTVPAYFLEQLVRYVEAVDFRNMRDTYPSSLSDVRTTYTLVDWGDEVKVIENQDGNAPVTVWALERLLLDLLREATWD